MSSVPPEGVFVPVPTFLKEPTPSRIQAEVDVEAQVKHSIHLAKNGIRGLVLLGSTGEAIHLSRTERFDFLAGVRKGMTDAGFPDYPIMAGVLTNSAEEAIEWLEDSKKAGAQWGLVLAPGYFGLAVNQENIQEWYTLVADKSPIPILTLDPAIDHENFRVYSGFGQQLGPIVFFGAAGVIDGLAALFPRTVARLFELASTRPITPENLAEVQKIQFAVSRAEEFIGKWGVIGIKEGVYQVLKIGNLSGGRLPLKGSLPKGEWESWSFAFDPLKKLEES